MDDADRPDELHKKTGVEKRCIILADRLPCRFHGRMRLPVPNVSIPIADIAVTKNSLIVQNRSGAVRYDVQITIDDKYTYVADVLPLGKSSLPLDEFVDDQGYFYKRRLLNIRNVSIYMPDTVDGKGYYRW